jgi:hypothetical protein
VAPRAVPPRAVPDPYTPPGSPVGDPPDARKRSSIAAVAIGFFVDIGATMIFGVVLAVAGGVGVAAGGASPAAVEAIVERSAGFQLLGLAGGLVCTALGGYVAARFANHSEYANAFAVGLASLVFGEVMLLVQPQDYPVWLRLLGDALVIPAALVGGHLRTLQKRAAA